MEKVKFIVEKLKEAQQTISFAESCTGGRVASAFTAIAGVSAVLNGSVVSYSNEIKHQWLGVSKDVLENYGAVSKECVEQMLRGVAKMAHSDYALAISGIAGPDGGSECKPVGTVYVGVLTPDTIEITHNLFEGDREAVQEQSTQKAIEMLYEQLIAS
ncbi:MAG: CinA family protein [Campylobacterales bacterium]|nr:CinA family protein [Campylobacterales bacterium]